MPLFGRRPNYGGVRDLVIAGGKQGGLTYDPRTGKYVDKGYAVSTIPKKYSEYKHGRLSSEKLAEYIYQKSPLLKEKGNMIGLWRDDASGKVYYDVSTVVGSKEVAKNLAKQNKQLASYDLKRGQEIRY